MRLIFSAPVITTVYNARNILECEGIECVIKREFLSAASGMIPPQDTWAELWILDDTQEEEARKTIDAIMIPARQEGEAQNCPSCNNLVEAPFTQCWNCGTDLAPAG